MARDEKRKAAEVEPRRQEPSEEAAESHVVFDFTGLEEPDVCDLSLIITARLQSAPTESVWVRSLPWHTAKVLRILRLDHLFRTYPNTAGELN